MDSPRAESLLQGLAVPEPWYLYDTRFDDELNGYVVCIDFVRGSRFTCSVCGEDGCKPYDSYLRRWRHLDSVFGRVYIQAYTPRVECWSCGVRIVGVPWARSRIRFTKLFEANVAKLAAGRSIREVARIVGEYDTLVRRLVQTHAGKG